MTAKAILQHYLINERATISGAFYKVLGNKKAYKYAIQTLKAIK